MVRIFHWFLFSWFALVSADGFYELKGSPSPKYLIEGIERNLRRNDRNISGPCYQALSDYSRALQTQEQWSLNMYGSSSIVPTITMTGRAGDFGVFDQCLNVEGNTKHGTVFGKYCLGLRMSPLGKEIAFDIETIFDIEQLRNSMQNANTSETKLLLWAVCSPSACSAEEIQEYHAESGVDLFLIESLCQEKLNRPPLDSGALTTITVFAIILGIMGVSTAYDAFLHYQGKDATPVLFTAFSILKNGKRLLKTSSNPNEISCLHGIRAITMMMVINGHKYVLTGSIPLVNSADFFGWSRTSKVAGATFLGIDSFLLLSGLLVAYQYMNSTEKGRKLNLTKYYVRRYFRLTPVLAVIMLVDMTLINYFVTSPIWPAVSQVLSQPCQNRWWSVLLYVQNYAYPTILMCVGPSWYLSVDTQLYFLAPLILIPLRKKPKHALTAIGLLTFCSILSASLTVWFYKIRRDVAGQASIEEILNYHKHFYYPTHTRATSWFVGIALGYLIHQTNGRKGDINIEKHQLRKIVQGLWVLTAAVLLSCVFGSYSITSGDYKRLDTTFYLGVMPLFWALGVGWVIFACVHGHGGPVNWLLSLPFFKFLSKLSYSMYLVHMLLLYVINLGQATSHMYFSNSYIIYSFWGDLVFTTLAAIVLVLAIEFPVYNMLTIMNTKNGQDKKVEGKQEDVLMREDLVRP